MQVRAARSGSCLVWNAIVFSPVDENEFRTLKEAAPKKTNTVQEYCTWNGPGSSRTSDSLLYIVDKHPAYSMQARAARSGSCLVCNGVVFCELRQSKLDSNEPPARYNAYEWSHTACSIFLRHVRNKGVKENEAEIGPQKGKTGAQREWPRLESNERFLAVRATRSGTCLVWNAIVLGGLRLNASFHPSLSRTKKTPEKDSIKTADQVPSSRLL
ncbi:hypothetical protein C8R45DRAFT_928038 [Mycena sanguinolenta]|nr:hypothetical protein C8R45DRAFT_928038 [Mycena sanguinolenta]